MLQESFSLASNNGTWILLPKQMTYIWQMWGKKKSDHINQTQPIKCIRSKEHNKEKDEA